MKTFIGLLYFHGLYGRQLYQSGILFAQKYLIRLPGACMSRNRFEIIEVHNNFDDIDKRKEGLENDQLESSLSIVTKTSARHLLQIIICPWM